MELVKNGHACVTLVSRGLRILIDPGAFTPDVPQLLAEADTVLVTHSHIDHFDAEALTTALDARPELPLFGPSDVVDALAGTASAANGHVAQVDGGETFDVLGATVRAVGGEHASIHAGIAVPYNVGYVIDGLVYHPGDALRVPPVPVHTLLVPVSGPWTKVGDAIDFIDAVDPEQTVQIHDAMLSEVGVRSTTMFLGESGLTGRPMVVLGTGESLDVTAGRR